MKLYFECAKCLDQLDAKRGSVKSVLTSLDARDRPRGAALIIETLKYKAALTTILVNSTLLQQERKHIKSTNLGLLLVHDLLLAKGIQAGDGPVKQAVLRHKARLQAELVRLKIARGISSNAELAISPDERSSNIPRYARVNTCLWNTASAQQYFVDKGFSLVEKFSFGRREFALDPHIPDLLVFNPDTSLHSDEAYMSGKVILQDKASCMPAVVLAPPSADNVVVIDATAAPGNKTSHLSALMQNKGKIFAFERDVRRFAILNKMLANAGCTNVTAIHADFLAVNPKDQMYGAVTHILLDPSCSGSGIVNRLDYLLEADDNEDKTQQAERLNRLSAFQLSMIEHAMSFPSVMYIVYSTCSIHAAENERVVQDALSHSSAQNCAFILCNRDQVIPTWQRRGIVEELGTDASKVIRCDPSEDQTNGFFVALFKRKTISSKASEGNKATGKRRPEWGENGGVKKRRKRQE